MYLLNTLPFWLSLLAMDDFRPALALEHIVQADQPGTASVDVRGTILTIRLPDGAVLGPDELRGAVLEANDEGGRSVSVRIEDVVSDSSDPEREVLLYRLQQLGEDGNWEEFCAPDPAGERWAFPLIGTWTASGEHLPTPNEFNFVCSAGAIGKCIRLGYKPWKMLSDGSTLWAYHQACVRMLRADYCGDGTSLTRDGTLIDLYDIQGIQKDEPSPGMHFEAGWSSSGATCVARPRIPENGSLSDIKSRCPERLAGHLGEICTEEYALRIPTTLMLNKSGSGTKTDRALR